ncbi:MAG: hypothetical protein HFE41_04900 [Clostridia bacterium]|jgi:hypothetical protein|nr:hypothetical protein [Clostridia bacterium]
MKTLKIKFCTIIALALVAVLALGTYLGLTVAADRDVTLTGSSVFYTSGKAEVWAHEEKKENADSDFYTMFVLRDDGDSVNFRKNLAYSWIYNDAPEAEEGKTPELMAKDGALSLEIGFELNSENKVPFEKFVLTFESQEYSQTKDGKAVNYIVFYPNADATQVYALITQDIDEELPENPVAINPDHIKIQLEKHEGGKYFVKINDGLTGEFENVHGNYARYSSSTTTPVTPLSFNAKFAENAEESAKLAKTAIYNLNGQSFKLSGAKQDGDHYTGGKVNDNTPPVLCLDKGVSYIGLGEEISFSYTVIDVLTSSPSLETSYFMLTKEQAADNDFNAENYTSNNFKTDGEDVSSKDKLFKVVTDSEDQKMIPHVTHYLPKTSDYSELVFNENFEVKAAVKVLLKLTDTTSSNGQSTYVMLDWFVQPDRLIEVNGQRYIAVATDTRGAAFGYTDGKQSNTQSNEWKQAVADYQKKVDEAAEGLMAGSKNKFYLPSVESLLKDNATDYEDLTFYIFYNNGSQQQESNKSANTLSIPLNKAGKYVFTIYAQDASGKSMYYYKPTADGEPEFKEFTTSDIWGMYSNEKDYEDCKQYLPWFEFNVSASEISIETPEEQSTAYVGSSYSPDSFDINGVSYNTKYNLYLFNSDLYYRENNQHAMTYDEFMALKDSFLTDKKDSMRKYFTYIYASSELTEGTEEYEKYHDYEWNSSSPKFTPQDANAFYLLECKVTSSEGGTQEATAYMGIACAPKVANLKGEDTWVADNITSIVLLSIAGASLIGIVLLLVIKPKNKGDLDEA